MPDRFVKLALVAGLASLGAACTSRARVEANRGASSDAALAAAPFVCAGNRCVQRYPRFPDDGEWTCSDTGGAAVCSGGDPPAGIPFNVADRAWICGQRRAGSAVQDKGERVCVDLTPDFPNGAAPGWRCHYAAEETTSRICERDPTVHVIGDRCDPRTPCLDGLRCIGARCTPERPSPSCILDGDCSEGLCRFGSCWRGPT